MGPASAPDSFAGPVDTACRDAFLEAHAAWSKHPETEVLCGGGLLERAGDSRIYLAPSSFAVSWPVPDLPVAGPMLVVVRCTSEQARAGAESALREHGQVVAIGVRSGTYDGAVAPQADVDHSRRAVRYIRGALLVERLPPGLPEPRPV
jgi:hypothetical protein